MEQSKRGRENKTKTILWMSYPHGPREAIIRAARVTDSLTVLKGSADGMAESREGDLLLQFISVECIVEVSLISELLEIKMEHSR